MIGVCYIDRMVCRFFGNLEKGFINIIGGFSFFVELVCEGS